MGDAWSDKRDLAETANIAQEFLERLLVLCERYSVKPCSHCRQFMAPGYKHYCPHFDREKGEETDFVKPGKHTH